MKWRAARLTRAGAAWEATIQGNPIGSLLGAYRGGLLLRHNSISRGSLAHRRRAWSYRRHRAGRIRADPPPLAAAGAGGADGIAGSGLPSAGFGSTGGEGLFNCDKPLLTWAEDWERLSSRASSGHPRTIRTTRALLGIDETKPHPKGRTEAPSGARCTYIGC